MLNWEKVIGDLQIHMTHWVHICMYVFGNLHSLQDSGVPGSLWGHGWKCLLPTLQSWAPSSPLHTLFLGWGRVSYLFQLILSTGPMRGTWLILIRFQLNFSAAIGKGGSLDYQSSFHPHFCWGKTLRQTGSFLISQILQVPSDPGTPRRTKEVCLGLSQQYESPEPPWTQGEETMWHHYGLSLP